MEPDADCLRPDSGAPLFEDGKPTAALNESVAFCSAFRDNLDAAAALGRALEAEGLLEEEEANITFTHGGASRVRGFKVVKPERLDRLSDETFLDWRRRGWLGPLYAHLHSMARWGRLIELAAPAPPARTVAATDGRQASVALPGNPTGGRQRDPGRGRPGDAHDRPGEARGAAGALRRRAPPRTRRTRISARRWPWPSAVPGAGRFPMPASPPCSARPTGRTPRISPISAGCRWR